MKTSRPSLPLRIHLRRIHLLSAASRVAPAAPVAASALILFVVLTSGSVAVASGEGAAASEANPTTHATGTTGTTDATRAPDLPDEMSCAQRVAVRVQSHYEGIRDFQAAFEQHMRPVSIGGGVEQPEAVSRGRVTFAKPGRMRWVYESPQRSEVVSDGSSLWIYDVDSGEAQHLSTPRGYLSGAALGFLLGEGDLLAEFDVSSPDCGAAPAAEPLVSLDLRPKQPATYERLGFRANAVSGAIVETTLVDLLGNVTRIGFEEIRVNMDPPSDVFDFHPPAGVEVIELDPMR